MNGVIFDIKRFAVHDGPGIRTTVFLKGCPLRCAWCHNPESQGFGIESLTRGGEPVTVGRSASVDALVTEIERDTSFFDESGGGVTFSGGEPLSQPVFLGELLDRCGERDIHRAVDTSGQAPTEVVTSMAGKADLFLFDLKLCDASRHAAVTGEDTALIHANLRALCETAVPVELRIPVIPGINDSAQDIEDLGRFVQALPRRLPLRLLGYHAAAMDKYSRFGLPVPLPDTPEPTGAELNELRQQLRAMDVEVVE